MSCRYACASKLIVSISVRHGHVGIVVSRIKKRRGNKIARHACADSKNVGMIEGQTVVQPVDADRVEWIHARLYIHDFCINNSW